MRKVVTINKKIEFDENLDEVQTSVTKIRMNGTEDNVETKIFPQSEKIAGYNVFKIIYYKKYNVTGMVAGKPFDSILRKYEIPVLVSDSKKYVLSYSPVKGIIARAALKRVRKDTKVKCSPIKINLFDAYSCILRNLSDVKVYSGWFSKLGEQLQNALLQGNSVDEDSDWKKYRNKNGAELKNIQLRFFDDKYTTGSVIISISSRGFIFSNSLVLEKDFFEIVDKIVYVLDRGGIIRDAEEDEEVEETIYISDKES